EHQPPALGVPAALVVAQPAAQGVQGPDLAVDVADDVDGPVEQLSHQEVVAHLLLAGVGPPLPPSTGIRTGGRGITVPGDAILSPGWLRPLPGRGSKGSLPGPGGPGF